MEKNNLKIVLSIVAIMTTIAFIFSFLELIFVAYLSNVHVSNVWNIDPKSNKNMSYLLIPILVLSIVIAIILITMIILQITKYKNNKINIIITSVLMVLILSIFILTLFYINDFVYLNEGTYYVKTTQLTPLLTIYECTFGIIINSLIPTLIIFISSIYNKLHENKIVSE